MLLKLNITKSDAYRVYLLIMGMRSLALSIAFTVMMVYQVTQVGLNPLQLVLIGTALELTVFLLEIPTGVVADVYSRRLSVMIGYSLLGIGIIAEGSFPVFEAIVIAEIIAGVGYTFLSGATSAWLVDEVGQERATQAFLRSSQLDQVMSIVGVVVSVILASINLQLSMIVSGCLLLVLVLILAFIMPEDGFQRVPKAERESWSDLFSTFRKGVTLVRGRRILMAILLVTLIYGAFTEGFDRLWTANILLNFELPALAGLHDIVWFGIIRIIERPITLVMTEVVRRKVDLTNSRAIAQVLAIVYMAMMVSALVFALSSQFWLMLLGLWFAGSLRKVSYPLMEAWINQHTESNVRATVLSIQGQTDAFGQIGGGPVVGVIGTIASVRVALSLSALMLSPLIVVFNRTLKQDE